MNTLLDKTKFMEMLNTYFQLSPTCDEWVTVIMRGYDYAYSKSLDYDETYLYSTFSSYLERLFDSIPNSKKYIIDVENIFKSAFKYNDSVIKIELSGIEVKAIVDCNVCYSVASNTCYNVISNTCYNLSPRRKSWKSEIDDDLNIPSDDECAKYMKVEYNIINNIQVVDGEILNIINKYKKIHGDIFVNYDFDKIVNLGFPVVDKYIKCIKIFGGLNKKQCLLCVRMNIYPIDSDQFVKAINYMKDNNINFDIDLNFWSSHIIVEKDKIPELYDKLLHYNKPIYYDTYKRLKNINNHNDNIHIELFDACENNKHSNIHIAIGKIIEKFGKDEIARIVKSTNRINSAVFDEYLRLFEFSRNVRLGIICNDDVGISDCMNEKYPFLWIIQNVEIPRWALIRMPKPITNFHDVRFEW